MKEIKTVRDLIDALLDYNLDAEVFIGDNLYNEVELSYGGSDGCTPKTCEHVGLHMKYLHKYRKDEDKVEHEVIDDDFDVETEPKEDTTLDERHYCTELLDHEHYYEETLVITDPCYLKGSTPDMRAGTIYGDWTCMVYPGHINTNHQYEIWDEKYVKFFNKYNFAVLSPEEQEKVSKEFRKEKEKWIKENTLGEFCADAGEVGVFRWSAISSNDKAWINEHPGCAAIIENVTGTVWINTTVDSKNGSKSRHIICDGETPFFTMQSGL